MTALLEYIDLYVVLVVCSYYMHAGYTIQRKFLTGRNFDELSKSRKLTSKIFENLFQPKLFLESHEF